MKEPTIDRSLSEVREWREGLQKELTNYDSEAFALEINRRARAFLKVRGLELRLLKSESFEPSPSR